jgi:hypothetical protein
MVGKCLSFIYFPEGTLESHEYPLSGWKVIRNKPVGHALGLMARPQLGTQLGSFCRKYLWQKSAPGIFSDSSFPHLPCLLLLISTSVTQLSKQAKSFFNS